MKRCCEGVGLPCLFKVSAILTRLILSERGCPLSSQGQGAGIGSPSCKPLASGGTGAAGKVSGCCWGAIVALAEGSGWAPGGRAGAHRLCTVLAKWVYFGFRAGQESALSYLGLLGSLRSPTQGETASRRGKNQPAKGFPLSGRARLLLAARAVCRDTTPFSEVGQEQVGE